MSSYRYAYGNMAVYVNPAKIPPYPDQRMSGLWSITSSYAAASNLTQNKVGAYSNVGASLSMTVAQRLGNFAACVPGRLGKMPVMLPIRNDTPAPTPYA